jgi:glycosyltransferase involved in cell wall biosynthesis
MAIGTPVIASGNGVNDETNVNDNIFLFSPYNYRDLAEKIRTVLGSKKVREGLIIRSRKIVSNYTWQKIARLYINVFSENFLKKTVNAHRITG